MDSPSLEDGKECQILEKIGNGNVLRNPDAAWRALIYFSRRKPYVVGMNADTADVIPSITSTRKKDGKQGYHEDNG